MSGKASSNVLKEKVENLGVMLEKFGRTPIEGRVFAYLLLSDPPYRTFDELVEFVSAGKSSISNAVNMFLKEGTLTYKTFSGDRKRYFMVDTKGWKKNFEDSIKNLSALNIVLEDVIKFRGSAKDKDFNKDLRAVLNFQTHVTNEITKTINKWNKE